MLVWLILAMIVAILAIDVVAIAGTIDAANRPTEVWQRAGYRKMVWVWQAFGYFCAPVALGYSGTYFLRVRPRLRAAARELAIEHMPRRPRSASPVSSGPVRIGLPLRVALCIPAAYLLIPVVVSTVVAIQIVAGGDEFSWSDVWWSGWIPWCVVAAVLLAANLYFGATLRSEELVLRGLLRRRVRRADVLAITAESSIGSSYVRIWTTTGSRRLRAPITVFDLGRDRFEADLAELTRWWQQGAPAPSSP